MNQTKKNSLFGVVMLLLTAFIWGVAFVAQSAGMESVEAFTFNGIRTLLGAAVLTPYILLRDRQKRKNMTAEQISCEKKISRRTVLCGIPLGVVFCAASNFQQFAFYDSSSGKIAFITALYIFFVPLLGLFIGKRVSWLTWICVAVGFVGLYFLCVSPGANGGISFGDILAFICSILFAVQILMVERFTDADGVKLSWMQLIVSGVLSTVLMFVFETPQIGNILSAAVPILYAGILSCGLAYTFQIIGQKHTEATVASLIMCMESVFGVLAGAILLQEKLSGREIFGCAVMFAAIVASQFSEKFAQRKK